ncbi:MAG TPA: TRAP transporter small permease [Syntrophorhabdales bacterium]|nr:TRAP transporter small permease [Syntrophorhabdales bacterium]
MRAFISATFKSSGVLNTVGGVVLALMMLLTVLDVILRYVGKAITGTFELMSFGGALVAGFAIAQTSLDGAHVNVDMITHALSKTGRRILTVLTKLLGLGVFLLLAWSLYLKGNDLYSTGEVSLTLHVPFYPVAYALSLSSLVECLVLVSDILKAIFKGAEHE